MLISYYGDDFTGSTDTMEALAVHGLRTALFTRLPNPAEFGSFADYDAVGLAGTSRSESPEWMDAHLAPAFRWLKSLGARISHYKVCSTFDSSPRIGSIGRAIEIGRGIHAQDVVPVIAGVPQLRRFTAFGNLFAAYQNEIHRIDRHPVMSRHPVTPMAEADLRLHLAQQTNLPVSLLPIHRIGEDAALDALADSSEGILLIDVMDMDSQLRAGRHLLRLKRAFVAGSSGVSYAVARALAEEGAVPGRAEFAPMAAKERIAVVSGSCSPTTERQIRAGLAKGFAGIPADPLALARNEQAADEIAGKALTALNEGRSPIIYSALGSADEKLAAMADGRHRLGRALGRIARLLIERARLERLVIAGGDTSSHALGELDIFALTTRFPLKATPGSPLCLAHSANPALQGLEIALKGGQLGGEAYFAEMRDGV